MGAGDDTVSQEVLLARMEGKLDRIVDGQARQQDDIKDLRERSHGHSNRIGALEAAKYLSEGERKGVVNTMRAVYALAGSVGIGGIAMLARVVSGH